MMLNRVSLNTIGLNRIGLNRIGKPSRGSSDRPYIDPEVLASLKAVCICYGKSNDDPDRAIVKNLVDPDNPFVISNAAFKLNSGFGKYEVDFTVYNNQNVLVSPNKIVSIAGREFISLLPYTELSKTISSYKIKVTGLIGELSYWYRNQDGSESRIIITKDGIYQLSTCYNVENGQGSSVGFNGYSESSCTIEQIPSFEGAFVTDGIDDLITSTKTVQEMLGGSNEITVVSMIHQIDGNIKYTNGYTNYIRHGGGFIRNVVEGANGKGFNKTGIYGYTSTNLNSSSMNLGNIVNNILGDKDDYSFERSSTYTLDDAKYSVQNFVNANNQPSNEGSSVAWYWTIIANKVLTTDQINQVIAYFNLDRTLKPDILCNVKKQGITNENHAEFGDRLIDFSGNGRDIQLNNLAWDGDSGIGKYNYPNWKVTATIANTYSTIVNYPTVNGTYSINVNGVSELMQSIGLHLEIKYTTSTGIIYNDIKQDGVYSYILPDGATDLTLRFGGIPGIVNEPCNITITQIPSHAGALCLDGVNDFGQFVGDLELKDYTFIADRAYSRIAPSQVPFIASTQTNGQAPFLMEYLNEDTYVYPHSFGTTTKTTNLNIQRQISYQSTYVYNGNSISKGTSVDTGDGLTIGNSGSTGLQYSPLCLWSLMLFPYSMSEFLIERQLKKHKLGTLYPDMVEFRPIIKQDDRIKSIKYYIDNKTANIGQYYPIGTGLGIAVETVKPYMVKSLKVNGVNTIHNVDYKGFNARLDSKSPQKITLDIQVDSSLVQWNPVVESNVSYKSIRYYKLSDSGSGWSGINIGDYIPIGKMMMITIDTVNTVDELVSAVSSQLTGIGINGSNGTYNITGTLTSESPQNINITIDEYIRYEDIVQPYPYLVSIKNYAWEDKIKVGTEVTITNVTNLLNGLYDIKDILFNDVRIYPGAIITVEKSMVFKPTSVKYLLDNNEPKCILSPSRLRMPNSSYKILGHIPDISGHGNHGKINNSAYAGMSGVNEDGSYQLDGVNDFITIPTLSSGGKQVLMKVNNNTINSMLYDQRSSRASPNSLNSDFAIYCTNSADNNQIAYQARLVGNTYIDGILNTNITCEDLLNVLHNITITCDIVAPNNGVVPYIGVGGVLKDLYSKVALYDFMLFDDISTDDKIKQVNNYIGIEAKVELPPYYWDAYGKTNLDADKATIQQRGTAVGDYDITNYNHAYDKMSGYGGYAFAKFDNTSEWIYTNNSDTIEVVNRDGYDVVLRKVGNGTNYWHFRNTIIKSLGQDIQIGVYANKSVQIVWQLKYKLEGETDYNTLAIASPTIEGNINTYVTLPYKTEQEIADLNAVDTYYSIYFIPIDLDINEEVTIEMLPLYPNGLVYDGITDYSENANIPALTDYTYIFKRRLLNDSVNSASMNKGLTDQQRATVIDFSNSNGNIEGYSFGNGIPVSSLKDSDIIYGTTNSVNGTNIIKGSNPDSIGINISKFASYYKQMIFYKLMLYPKTIPLLQINFLKNLMERDEIIDLNNKIFIQE